MDVVKLEIIFSQIIIGNKNIYYRYIRIMRTSQIFVVYMKSYKGRDFYFTN